MSTCRFNISDENQITPVARKLIASSNPRVHADGAPRDGETLSKLGGPPWVIHSKHLNGKEASWFFLLLLSSRSVNLPNVRDYRKSTPNRTKKKKKNLTLTIYTHRLVLKPRAMLTDSPKRIETYFLVRVSIIVRITSDNKR